MSVPSSPAAPNDKQRAAKKRDRPPALDLPDGAATNDHFDAERAPSARTAQPQVHVLTPEDKSEENPPSEHAVGSTRSSSATSSLDPYYFGAPSSTRASPVPPVPELPLPRTPEVPRLHANALADPTTPGRDPSSIDRQGLIGVGDLATPRWIRKGRRDDEGYPRDLTLEETVIGDAGEEEEEEEELPGSPWTIEAVDGEDEQEQLLDVEPLPSHTIRTRPSITEESGGEEILYPRKSGNALAKQAAFRDMQTTSLSGNDAIPAAPPSSYSPLQPTANRPRKRTSEEFTLDQAGELISITGSTAAPKTPPRSKEESARRHRSLGPTISSTPPRDRGKTRRGDSVTSTLSKSSSLVGRHSRQASAGSSSSSPNDATHSRRSHPHDFSHLPPSPSSTAIQHFIKQGGAVPHSAAGSLGSQAHTKDVHVSPSNVAHSLLRGTQEGWATLDDSATMEALRKLDGVAGKSARARSSVGSSNSRLSNHSTHSRPGTPAAVRKNSTEWEGVGVDANGGGGKSSRRSSGTNLRDGYATREREDKDAGSENRQVFGLGLAFGDPEHDNVLAGASGNGDDIPMKDRPQRKSGSGSARSSFTPKRSSASSTTYTTSTAYTGTPTTSSRDSTSFSTAPTSVTSPSVQSNRIIPVGKVRSNSVSSDTSVHSNDGVVFRDRATSLASNGEVQEGVPVPPVPPLPKDLASYKSPPQSSTSFVFPVFSPPDENGELTSEVSVDESDADRTLSLDPLQHQQQLSPKIILPGQAPHSETQDQAQSLAAPAPRTPSKKWSFSNALNLRLSSTPSSSSLRKAAAASASPLSPRSTSFAPQRKLESRENPISPSLSKPSGEPKWAPSRTDAMNSAASLASVSSANSTSARARMSPAPPSAAAAPRSPETGPPSRSGTASSASNHTTNALGPSGPHGPSSKRLTPSNIPFFRRSSSQSMHSPPSTAGATVTPTTVTATPVVVPSSPTSVSTPHTATQLRAARPRPPSKDGVPASPATLSVHRKSSVFQGLPSLLKGSSSRKSLQSEKSDSKSARDLQREREMDERQQKERQKQEKERHKLEKERPEKDKQRKDEKDRSESRISVLMGRKRGKTLSSGTENKKVKPMDLPPMQISAIPSVTVQRLNSMTSKSGSPTSSTSSNGPLARATSVSSRATAQTMSSLQKQSDSSLRRLPTIAGSPSVGTVGHTGSIKEPKDLPPSVLSNSSTSLPKETPTKIPRISSRSSTTNSPTLKSSAYGARRASGPSSSQVSSVATDLGESSMNEFGMLDNETDPTPPPPQPRVSKASGTTGNRNSLRVSPSALSTSTRVPRQSATISSNISTSGVRKSNRDSMSFGLRKSSTASVTSNSTTSETSHRFSALSPSKGLNKLLNPKLSLPAARGSSSSGSASIHQAMGTPTSSRHSLATTPSPVPSSVDEEELNGDEEMMQHIKKSQARKLASGAKKEELEAMLRFPEPIDPVPASTPQDIFDCSDAQYLSEYERTEILDYPSVYCIGARSAKKPATRDNTTNNHGYDDDRGDYLVVNHDHLAYRYEVMDTLGKGSFGQVLQCRDHRTGESVAIKIIRNKKRFHHQALVEIKILDNLRKWDPDEKHYVIKMNEHFYFRGHLCIAMELLSINLYELIKANGFHGFTTTLIRRFTSQMLLSLSLMRHHRIVHCDLKPENVLLKHPTKSGIKVIDFGSSCFEHEKVYTYIQSRFYRSPEVILGMNYNMAIDMWSLGCILAELSTGYPIFPGENEQEQLSCIMEVLGVPDKDLVARASRRRLFFDTSGSPRPVVNSKGRRRRPGTKTLAQVLRCDDELFVDFISKCLMWDPERRIKPQPALRHPFLLAGKRSKPLNTAQAAARSILASTTSSTSTRHKVPETPKKSQIGAPAPLSARSSRTIVPSTPSTSHSTLTASARSYRTSQPISHYSSRTLSGYVSSSTANDV